MNGLVHYHNKELPASYLPEYLAGYAECMRDVGADSRLSYLH